MAESSHPDFASIDRRLTGFGMLSCREKPKIDKSQGLYGKREPKKWLKCVQNLQLGIAKWAALTLKEARGRTCFSAANETATA